MFSLYFYGSKSMNSVTNSPNKIRKGLLYSFIFLLTIQLSFGHVSIRGGSMEPAYSSGEKVIICKHTWLFPIVIGDVIVFEKDSEIMTKRVKYIFPDGFFVLGDDRESSLDSRDFGLISPQEVLGKVLFPRPID